MPTGYTAGVMSGNIVNPIDYIKICARSCGGLAFMEDGEPLDAPIPTQVPTDMLDHYKGELDALRVRRHHLLRLTWDEITAKRQADFEKKCKHYQEYHATCAIRRVRYQDMINAVSEWKPDDDTLFDLKAFAIEQLEKSMRSDCDSYNFPTPVVLTNEEWLSEQLADIDKEIEIYQKWVAEEEESLCDNQKWLDKFHKSLNDFAATRPAVKKAEGAV